MQHFVDVVAFQNNSK